MNGVRYPCEDADDGTLRRRASDVFLPQEATIRYIDLTNTKYETPNTPYFYEQLTLYKKKEIHAKIS